MVVHTTIVMAFKKVLRKRVYHNLFLIWYSFMILILLWQVLCALRTEGLKDKWTWRDNTVLWLHNRVRAWTNQRDRFHNCLRPDFLFGHPASKHKTQHLSTIPPRPPVNLTGFNLTSAAKSASISWWVVSILILDTIGRSSAGGYLSILGYNSDNSQPPPT